jgi:hypothetical protein
VELRIPETIKTVMSTLTKLDKLLDQTALVFKKLVIEKPFRAITPSTSKDLLMTLV